MAKEVVILSKEEYQSLLDKSTVKVSSSDVVISADELNYLRGCEYSLHSFYSPDNLCPRCGKAVLIRGYRCPCCDYDPTADDTSTDDE